MKNISGICLLTIGVQAFAATNSPPFFQQPTQEHLTDIAAKGNLHHVRVVLSTDEVDGDSQVSIGNLALCSKSACFQPSITHQTDLVNTAQGLGTVVADIDYPGESIDSIFFGSVAASKSIDGAISLVAPMKLDSAPQGAEVMVTLAKRVDGIRTIYSPKQVATGALRQSGVSVYYNPKFSTK